MSREQSEAAVTPHSPSVGRQPSPESPRAPSEEPDTQDSHGLDDLEQQPGVSGADTALAAWQAQCQLLQGLHDTRRPMPGRATGAETLIGSQRRRTAGAAGGGGGLEEMRVGPQEVLPAEEGREERACEQQDLTAANFLGLMPASQPSCLAERQHGLSTAVQHGLPLKEHGEWRGEAVREQPDLLVGTQPALSLTVGLAVGESIGLNPFPRAGDRGLQEGRAGAEDHAFLFQSTQGVQSAATSHVDVRPRRRGRGRGRARATERGCFVAQQGQQSGDHWD
ncbi:unnamed protein product [Closterium sp. Naga37s-1]|nr:unnamed protein product [Closterium sp. Naga37s-1]